MVVGTEEHQAVGEQHHIELAFVIVQRAHVTCQHCELPAQAQSLSDRAGKVKAGLAIQQRDMNAGILPCQRH